MQFNSRNPAVLSLTATERKRLVAAAKDLELIGRIQRIGEATVAAEGIATTLAALDAAEKAAAGIDVDKSPAAK